MRAAGKSKDLRCLWDATEDLWTVEGGMFWQRWSFHFDPRWDMGWDMGWDAEWDAEWDVEWDFTSDMYMFLHMPSYFKVEIRPSWGGMASTAGGDEKSGRGPLPPCENVHVKGKRGSSDAFIAQLKLRTIFCFCLFWNKCNVVFLWILAILGSWTPWLRSSHDRCL